MVKKPGGTGRDPVFQVEIDGVGREGLADGHVVPFSVGYTHRHTRDLPQELLRVGKAASFDRVFGNNAD